MDVFEITPPAGYSPVALAALVEQAAGACGLSISQITTLRTYPGSTHWHLKRSGAHGTLELTSWPQAGRLWFSVHANRQAAWVAPAIESLTARIVQIEDRGWQFIPSPPLPLAVGGRWSPALSRVEGVVGGRWSRLSITFHVSR